MGTFTITQINDNVTVCFQKGINNDATNICRINHSLTKIINNKKRFHNTSCFSLNKLDLKRFHNTVVSLSQMTMARFTFNKESSMMPLITYQHLKNHFYDLPHPNHRGEFSIPCSFDINRGSSIVVTHRTAEVRVTLNKPGTPCV